MQTSPYKNASPSEWPEITKKLVDQFPLSMPTLVQIVEAAWYDLYTASFGNDNWSIGRDILLPAQASGVILEQLIAKHLNRFSADWRGGNTKVEKDIVYQKEPKYSFEIKTSSSRSGLYGNRSTGHLAEGRKKFRTGYYLVINYKLPKIDNLDRDLLNIRFGWIDDEDWVGQAQPTGQQASIGVELARFKLLTIKGSL